MARGSPEVLRRLALLGALLGVAGQNFGAGGASMDDAGADEEGGGGMDAVATVKAPPCTFTAGGASFNLAGMKQSAHDYTGTTAGGYTYRFNVCGGTVKVCNRQQAPASKWRGAKCNNLGDMQTQEIALLNEANPSEGLKLTYRDGDICKKQVSGQMEIGSREVIYQVHCDRGQDGMLQKIVETSMCEYTIIFNSKHACPIGGSSGGKGWNFIFMVVLIVCLYLGIGIAFNKYKMGLEGVEAVPNIGFWRQVPGLVKDGVAFSTEKGKAGVDFVQQKYLRKG